MGKTFPHLFKDPSLRKLKGNSNNIFSTIQVTIEGKPRVGETLTGTVNPQEGKTNISPFKKEYQILMQGGDLVVIPTGSAFPIFSANLSLIEANPNDYLSSENGQKRMLKVIHEDLIGSYNMENHNGLNWIWHM